MRHVSPLSTHVLPALLLAAVLAACGGGGGTSSNGTGSTGGTTGTSSSTTSNTNTNATLAAFRIESVQPTTGVLNATCSNLTAANASVSVGDVRLGQTHLLPPSHPLFHLSAERETVVHVAVTGAGSAPQVSVQGSLDGQTLGTICLQGPATLSASVDAAAPDSGYFVGSIPAAWIKPGLALAVRADQSVQTISATSLRIGAAPAFSLVTMDWLMWGDTEPTPVPANMRAELASRLPLTQVNYSDFPVKPRIDRLPIPPRNDSLLPNGTAQTAAAMIADSRPSCSAADKAASTCKPWSGFGVLSAVRSLTEVVQRANGTDRLTHWYGALSKNRHVGGGLGGGVTGSGDDYDLVFNHELGHAFDMPHLGDALYSRVGGTATVSHPYTGQLLLNGAIRGGGVGNTWALDGLTGKFVSPLCNGIERQEPMQRGAGTCIPGTGVFDFFSDYAALSIHRYFVGSKTTLSGNVDSPRDALNNAMPRFSFATKSGRPNMQWTSGSGTPTISTWNETSATYSALTPSSVSSDTSVYGEFYPLQWNVPVITLWGSFSNATLAATTILPPMHYMGNLKRVWDPTNDAQLSALRNLGTGNGFSTGADWVVKAEFSDGSVRHALVKGSARGTDPLADTSFSYWAVNIPRPGTASLTQVTLFYRPMELSSSTDATINLRNSANQNLTGAQYMNTARVVATWQP